MYGETGELMRGELAALLRLHRVQQHLGGPSRYAPEGLATPYERDELGQQIRCYRQTIITWCSQALQAAQPVTFSNLPTRPSNPFRPNTANGVVAAELLRALEHTRTRSSAPPASIDLLTTHSNNQVVEHWRQAARGAALAEHDSAGELAGRLTAPQAQALVGDVAAVARALVVLDQRYGNTPGWEHLSQPDRLGWTALAAALDVSLGQPDYTVDQTGWRPRVKLIRGPTKPGILGVLQAEHNLLVRLGSLPSAMNLRLVVDSQRLLSSQLLPYAARIDERLAEQWQTRATTYATIQRELRNIGGRVGKGGLAAAEGATAISRLKSVPPQTVVAPDVLSGFQTLFNHIDARIADLVQDGVQRGAYLQRVTVPRVVDETSELIHPVRERFAPIAPSSDLALLRLVRHELRPPPGRTNTPTPGTSRADLHAALVHRPEPRAGRGDSPRL